MKMIFSPGLRSAFAFPGRFLRRPAALLAGTVLLLAACHPAVTDPKDPKFIVAEKGDWQILRGELDAEIATFLQQRRMQPDAAQMPKLETAMLNNMVLKKLLLEKAASENFTDLDKTEADELTRIKGPMTDDQLTQKLKAAGIQLDDLKKKIHEKVLLTKVLEKEAFVNDQPTEQEINDFYMKNQPSFQIPPQIRASRILIMVSDQTTPADKALKKKAIDKAYARVMKGEDFSKVAMEVSEDAYSKPRGGDIDWFRRGMNESTQFDDVAFSTPVGKVSPVFETSMGYQFLKVTDTRPAGVVAIADARQKISQYLTQMKRRQEEEAYTKKLLADSGVTFHLKMVDPTAADAPPPK